MIDDKNKDKITDSNIRIFEFAAVSFWQIEVRWKKTVRCVDIMAGNMLSSVCMFEGCFIAEQWFGRDSKSIGSEEMLLRRVK